MFFSKTSSPEALKKVPSFNPCSLGCFSRRVETCFDSFLAVVSILVLLDVFLEASSDRGASTLTSSFNPCSLGCFSRRGDCRQCLIDSVRVSILVLLDVFLEEWKVRGVNYGGKFQSLFSWMFFSKYACAASSRAKQGFNPCSLGCFSRSESAVKHTKCACVVSILVLLDVFLEEISRRPFGGAGVFQSLFSWMFFSKCITTDGKRRFFCFNPCSLGCFSRRCGSGADRSAVRKFQSLFSWMFFSKAARFWPFSAISHVNCSNFPHEFLHAKILIPI